MLLKPTTGTRCFPVPRCVSPTIRTAPPALQIWSTFNSGLAFSHHRRQARHRHCLSILHTPDLPESKFLLRRILIRYLSTSSDEHSLDSIRCSSTVSAVELFKFTAHLHAGSVIFHFLELSSISTPPTPTPPIALGELVGSGHVL
jgi:hypothetical protein